MKDIINKELYKCISPYGLTIKTILNELYYIGAFDDVVHYVVSADALFYENGYPHYTTHTRLIQSDMILSYFVSVKEERDEKINKILN